MHVADRLRFDALRGCTSAAHGCAQSQASNFQGYLGEAPIQLNPFAPRQ